MRSRGTKYSYIRTKGLSGHFTVNFRRYVFLYSDASSYFIFVLVVDTEDWSRLAFPVKSNLMSIIQCGITSIPQLGAQPLLVLAYASPRTKSCCCVKNLLASHKGSVHSFHFMLQDKFSCKACIYQRSDLFYCSLI